MVKLDILAIGAHPDDVELSCGGTLIHHSKQGKKVGILDLTAGEMGTRGSADIRLKEAEQAAKIMGVDVRINLGLKDCFFQQTENELIQLIEIIRLFKPEIILGNSPKDRHPDHSKAAKLFSDASYYSGLLKIQTNWEGQKQDEWRPKVVYHHMQDYY